MLRQSVIFLSCTMIGLVAFSGCSTTIRSYPVKEGVERQGGIPFYLPKPILQVQEPIEVGRVETLHAIIDVGGLEQFSITLDEGNMDQSIEKLRQLIGTGDIQIESKEKVPFYLTEELEKKKNVTGEHSSTEIEKSKKYSASTVSDTVTETKPLYKQSDNGNAISVIWVPDTDKEYELLISPSAFASSELSIKLADGWRFDNISVNTGENQLIKELGDTLRTVIGAQKEVKVAEISHEQAIKLKEMELASQSDGGEKTLAFREEKMKVPVRIIGFAKKTTISVIMPGLYELKFSNGSVSIGQKETVLWSRITL